MAPFMKRPSKKYNGRPRLGYKIFKAYIGFFHNRFYYRNVYWLNTENIPDNVPLMIASNHQNGLNDPLGVIFSVPNRLKRKIRFIARADVFLPAVKNILSWLGILPAFRNEHQGEGSAARNRFMLSEAEEELNLNGTVGIYPEAGHQHRHWLGRFSVGYLHIIFEAARLTDFQKEMFVLPSCNHYSNYFRFREQMLIKYGEPISLAPYYHLYRENPRAAQHEVNEAVRQQISDLMLNITDQENYDAIDFIRNTYGIDYARRKGLDPRHLPDKLSSDKQLFRDFEDAKRKFPKRITDLCDNADKVQEGIRQLNINDRDFDRKPFAIAMLLKGIGLILLSPLFVFACVPNILVYFAPRLMTGRIEDTMLHSGINLAVSAIITVPVLYILTFFLMHWLTGSWLAASIHFIALPFLAIFAWNYSRACKRWMQKLRFRREDRRGRLAELRRLREEMHVWLDAILFHAE